MKKFMLWLTVAALWLIVTAIAITIITVLSAIAVAVVLGLVLLFALAFSVSPPYMQIAVGTAAIAMAISSILTATAIYKDKAIRLSLRQNAPGTERSVQQSQARRRSR